MMRKYFRRIAYVVLILIIGVSLTGCAAFIVGGAVGVLGGYAVSRDTIQGEIDKSQDSLRTAAVQVLHMMDAQEIDESATWKISAKIGKSSAVLTFEQLTSETTRLKVRCRRYLLPNLKLAQTLYVRVIGYAD